jgi:hypothetical protein
MHTTKRPASHMRIPIQGKDLALMLAGIAYFNSLVCKTSIRFFSQQVAISARTQKGRTRGVRPEHSSIQQRSGAVVRVECWFPAANP